MDYWNEVSEAIGKGENVVLLANHQTEARRHRRKRRLGRAAAGRGLALWG